MAWSPQCACQTKALACYAVKQAAFSAAREAAIVAVPIGGGLTMSIILYDLAGAEAERRFSPFCWRTKMALAHKGLEADTVPWRFTEKDKLPQPNASRVPVIV